MRSILFVATMCAVAHAENVTYQIIPAAVAPDCPNILAGGAITTDGTLGALTAENIVSMSVDIRLGTWVLERGKEPQFLDGSKTLDLTNAALLLDGTIQATPTGIFIALPPPSPYERDFGTGTVIAPPEPNPDVVTYSLSLDGGDAHVKWSSVNLESYGVNNMILVNSAPAGGAGLHFAESGLIAQVVPEPATWVLTLSCVATVLAHRRAKAS
jgi:hypothetical protein